MANYKNTKSQGFMKCYNEQIARKTIGGDLMTRNNDKVKTWLFSLPPIESCLNCNSCKSDCFALKAYHQYPNVKGLWDFNFSLVKNDLFTLYDRLNDQLSRISKSRSKSKIVRIHQSGDFYNQNYLNMWCDLIAKYPNISFFGYTKVDKILDFSRMDKLPNCNIVRSLVDNKRNFGSIGYVNRMISKHGGELCEAFGDNRGSIHCGVNCFKCIENSNKNIFFVIH